MTLGKILLEQILLMFMLMGIGVLVYRKGFISKNGSKELGALLLYVVTPMITIKAYTIEASAERSEGLLVAALLSSIAFAISIFVARLFFRRHRLEHFGVAFSNAGFIGIPLVSAALGQEAVFYFSSFLVLASVLMWTYGIAILKGNAKDLHISRLLLNPIVISALIGWVIYVSGIRLPGLALSTLNSVSALNTPLAMFILGVYMAQLSLREIFRFSIVYRVMFLRLIVIPFLVLLAFIPIDAKYNFAKLTILIGISAPSAANTAIMAQQFHMDYNEGVKIVIVTTLFSIITLPLIILLAQTIGM